MNKITFLFPWRFRFLGIIFFVFGLLFGIARFKYGYKPEIFDLKMFAFFSSYLESKYMQFITNNMCEEITGFLALSGLFIMAFSREKNESELTNRIRLKAFFLAAYLNFLFLCVAFFFTYGFAFVYMLMANIGFNLLVYLVAFRIMIFLEYKREQN